MTTINKLCNSNIYEARGMPLMFTLLSHNSGGVGVNFGLNLNCIGGEEKY
jgi:hypothetical protein